MEWVAYCEPESLFQFYIFREVITLFISYEILNEPYQGLLKFLGSKPAKVKLSVIKEPEEYMTGFLKDIIHIIGLEGEVISKVEENGEDISLNINGKDLGLLIGKRGNTLNALQYLANVILHRQFSLSGGRTIIDIENYRQKRRVTLEQLAKNLADKAFRTNKDVILEPMNPQDRRIIHLALQNSRDVTTHSHGDEPYRKVVISPR